MFWCWFLTMKYQFAQEKTRLKSKQHDLNYRLTKKKPILFPTDFFLFNNSSDISGLKIKNSDSQKMWFKLDFRHHKHILGSCTHQIWCKTYQNITYKKNFDQTYKCDIFIQEKLPFFLVQKNHFWTNFWKFKFFEPVFERWKSWFKIFEPNLVYMVES